eukprot:contig_32270_g7847
MPLNSVPATVSAGSYAAKVAAIAADPPAVDVGLIGGAVGGAGGQTPADIVALIDAGVWAIKSFMVDSQSPNFPYVTLAEMRVVMDGLAGLGNRSVPYILHAELPPPPPSLGAAAPPP